MLNKNQNLIYFLLIFFFSLDKSFSIISKLTPIHRSEININTIRASPLPLPPPPPPPPRPSSSSSSSSEPIDEKCQEKNCQPTNRLIAILIGSIVGFLILGSIIFISFLIYQQKKKKQMKKQETQPSIHFIEQPPLYTDRFSENQSSSNNLNSSLKRNQSISSHHYEKILYNQ